MSRIGTTAIPVPNGVTLDINEQGVTVKGPKGQLSVPGYTGITVKVEEGKVMVARANDELQTKAFHGLVRSLVNNHIQGVTQGYKIVLKLIGTGYRATAQGANLSMTLGFSHPVVVKPFPGVTLKVEGNDTIIVEGIDKQQVGQMAADIRALKPPEPYKGKGIRYENETVLRKQGKAAA